MITMIIIDRLWDEMDASYMRFPEVKKKKTPKHCYSRYYFKSMNQSTYTPGDQRS